MNDKLSDYFITLGQELRNADLRFSDCNAAAIKKVVGRYIIEDDIEDLNKITALAVAIDDAFLKLGILSKSNDNVIPLKNYL